MFDDFMCICTFCCSVSRIDVDDDVLLMICGAESLIKTHISVVFLTLDIGHKCLELMKSGCINMYVCIMFTYYCNLCWDLVAQSYIGCALV